MFAAEFGVVDDYQIASVLLPSHRLESAAILPTLATWLQQDIGRFRPLRWTFWVTEAAIWGWNPAGWYLDRLLLAGVTVISTALLAARYAARPIAVVAGILVFVGLQSEAWYRLGTQETYGVPLLMSSLALVAWGRVRLGLLLAVLAALTKEAFVPMAALTVGWTFYLDHRRGAILGGLAVAAVGLAVLATWLSAGEPLQQTRSLLAIGSELKWMAWESAVVTLWPLFAVALALLDWRLAVIALSIAASIVLPQAILDVGGREGRYMLPAALGAVLITSMGLVRLTSRSRRLAVVATLALLVTTVSAATPNPDLPRKGTDSRDLQAGVSGARGSCVSTRRGAPRSANGRIRLRATDLIPRLPAVWHGGLHPASRTAEPAGVRPCPAEQHGRGLRGGRAWLPGVERSLVLRRGRFPCPAAAGLRSRDHNHRLGHADPSRAAWRCLAGATVLTSDQAESFR
jgi:hypothetical protein